MAGRDCIGHSDADPASVLLDCHEPRDLLDFQVRSRAGRDELLMIWDSLSPQGRRPVIIAARLTAHEEGLLPGKHLLR
ncbi:MULTISPECIES: hypothetical protein [Roseomonas]|uniref:hypothetical protein n=1 Tax=Roseomonas TaxID=125216 RepID=UPI000F8115D6|nr:MULTISPECIES: hypothetical protein [Roseomonas]MDT8351785.1 hypothetical protein [Roseomonas mucosa]